MSGQSEAAKAVLAERERQQQEEGWTVEHDDSHRNGEMAIAAACYALGDDRFKETVKRLWPWAWRWWKPKMRRRDLVRAGALIIAEIERLDRCRNTKRPLRRRDGLTRAEANSIWSDR